MESENRQPPRGPASDLSGRGRQEGFGKDLGDLGRILEICGGFGRSGKDLGDLGRILEIWEGFTKEIHKIFRPRGAVLTHPE